MIGVLVTLGPVIYAVPRRLRVRRTVKYIISGSSFCLGMERRFEEILDWTIARPDRWLEARRVVFDCRKLGGPS
jgi:predicted Fe-S protein YdhL (DUF1289 family)